MTDPLSVAGSVVGIISLGIQATQSLVEFYAAYKDQKSDVAYTTRKLERLLDVLETLRKQLDPPECRAYEQGLLKNVEKFIQDCEECILELQDENKKFKDNSSDSIRAVARTATRRLAYPFRQSTLQKLDENIEETVSSLSLALQVLQKRDIGKVQDDIRETKVLLDMVKADQVSSNIRDWLKAPDASIDYIKACTKKYTGTGNWLVQGSSFSSWLEKPNSFLWLNGFAGCGKSVLCSTAIEHVFHYRKSNPRFAIAFFFFNFDNELKQDASAMLRALVLQLSSQKKNNCKLLSELCNNYRNMMPPDHVLAECLRQLVRAFDHTYIILDALDESPRDKHRADVLQTLVEMRAWSEPGLHFLVTSRDETEIRDVFVNDLPLSQDEDISMKNDSVDSDIASFVTGYIRDNRQMRRWQEYSDQIEKALIQRANGM